VVRKGGDQGGAERTDRRMLDCDRVIKEVRVEICVL
jgi:hypothetical protein